MSRAIAFAVILALVAFLAIVGSAEHHTAGYAMPLVSSAAPAQPPIMLFAPCPLSPRNFARHTERKA